MHARLLTPLNSSTSHKGDSVEAIITEPLVASDHLILPEGSIIRGSVMQVQPARRLARNKPFRILFHEVAPPNGLEQKVVTSLEGVAVAKGEHLKLDAEGGAPGNHAAHPLFDHRNSGHAGGCLRFSRR